MPRDDDDDFDDRPRPRRDDDRRPEPNGIAVAGLVVGIVSLCLPLLAPVALLLGGVGLARSKSRGSGKGAAIGGLVTGAVGLVLVPVTVLGLYVTTRGVRDEASRRMQVNNFKQVGLAVHSYSDAIGRVPPVLARGPNGDANAPADPSTRLGWRVDVLPYLEQYPLYGQLDANDAWDGPKNRAITATPVQQFWDPSDGSARTNQTHLRAFVGPGAVFDPDPKRRVMLFSIADGTSNTLLFVDATQTVPWAQNNELPFTPGGPLPPLGHPSRAVFLACMGDGSVRVVRKDVNPALVRDAITHSGGETTILE